MATKKANPKAKKSVPKKRTPAVILKERESYMQSIGFEFIPSSKEWVSPHATCRMDAAAILQIIDEDWPNILNYYKQDGEFSQELFDKICEKIATSSQSTRSTCKENLINATTFYRWINKDEETGRYGGKLRNTYARAKEDQVEYLVDEMLEIADDGSNDLMTITKGDASYEMEDKEVTNRSKLRIDVRKFIASKLKPKKYGDSIDVKSNGEAIQQVVIYQLPDNGRDKK